MMNVYHINLTSFRFVSYVIIDSRERGQKLLESTDPRELEEFLREWVA